MTKYPNIPFKVKPGGGDAMIRVSSLYAADLDKRQHRGGGSPGNPVRHQPRRADEHGLARISHSGITAHRMTSMKMRGDVAMAGNLGYELDVTTLKQRNRK